jgi:hypothetical protein
MKMSSRDPWVENLRCPQCEKTGPAELSQMDGPFDIQVDIFQCRNHEPPSWLAKLCKIPVGALAVMRARPP